MEQPENPFAKKPEAVEQPVASEQPTQPEEQGAEKTAPESQADAPPPIDPVKERYGIGLDELEGIIQKANSYSWVDEDNFAKTLLSKYKEGNKVEDIVKTIGKDWAKADDVDIIREDLARQGFTESDLQDFHIAKLYGEFSPDDDSPEAKIARKQLANKASELRRQYQKEQEDFGKPVNYQEKEMAEFQKQIEQWHQYIEKDASTKTLMDNKRITFQYDGREQNLEVDPTKLVEMVKSPGKFIERIGEMSLATQYQVAAFLSDPEQFIGQIAEIGKLSAKEALLKEERNPEPQQPGIDESAKRKFTDRPVNEWTTDEKMEFLKNAQVKR